MAVTSARFGVFYEEMKRVSCLADPDAVPAPGSASDDGLPDFRHWLAAVQLGLRTGPGADDFRPPVDDRSRRPAGEPTNFLPKMPKSNHRLDHGPAPGT